jgi:hypothetical protein
MADPSVIHLDDEFNGGSLQKDGATAVAPAAILSCTQLRNEIF